MTKKTRPTRIAELRSLAKVSERVTENEDTVYRFFHLLDDIRMRVIRIETYLERQEERRRKRARQPS